MVFVSIAITSSPCLATEIARPCPMPRITNHWYISFVIFIIRCICQFSTVYPIIVSLSIFIGEGISSKAIGKKILTIFLKLCAEFSFTSKSVVSFVLYYFFCFLIIELSKIEKVSGGVIYMRVYERSVISIFNLNHKTPSDYRTGFYAL